MPQFDGTGPSGIGPKSGKGMGPCGRGFGVPRQGFGFRRDSGWGRGMGFGRRCAAWDYKDQTENLTDYKKALEEELDQINKDLEGLKSDK